MRSEFWRGMVTGGVIGTMIGLALYQRHDAGQWSGRRVRSRAQRVIRGVSRTVNDFVRP
ncbi:MAG: hypothetical protein M0Z41_18510 [Peptococcaceae bacterium]|nr:hypothetical protein [Peptococcaceae bacterium]